MAQIIENKKLTPKAKENLERNEEIRRNLERKEGQFIKMLKNEILVLEFNAEKSQVVEKDFGFGLKTLFEYIVVNPALGKEQTITFAKSWSKDIDAILSHAGPRCLIKVERIGEGKGTVYRFTYEGES